MEMIKNKGNVEETTHGIIIPVIEKKLTINIPI